MRGEVMKEEKEDGENENSHNKSIQLSRKKAKRLAAKAAYKERRKARRLNAGSGRSKVFEADGLENVQYFIHGNLRHTKPYMFDYVARTKARWFGRGILEVYSAEFVAYSKEYYKKAIESGRITVNGTTVSTDYKLKDGDKIKHSVHRHEPPVSADPVVVHFEDDETVVVSKPSGLPMHPCGQYRHNSLTYILAKQRNDILHQPNAIAAQANTKLSKNSNTVHRLDRLTSGLVVMAKTADRAASLSKQIRLNQVQKTYLARVRGRFPTGPEAFKTTLITVSAPIACADKRVGKQVCGERAVAIHKADIAKRKGQIELKREQWEKTLKHAQTTFRLLSYDGTTSLIECKPKTGRTHQIRVHLEWLGYPIANDPCYGGQLFESNSYPPYGGLHTRDKRDEDQKEEGSSKKVNDTCEGDEKSVVSLDIEQFRQNHTDSQKICFQCREGSYWTDSRRRCSHIWLHALKYEGDNGWVYEVPVPSWAKETFDSRNACSKVLPFRQHDA
eukprot:jgi/Bigna1/91418/estExt_fgenesh1_pg.C_1000027